MILSTDIEQFLTNFQNSVENDTFIKLTLSKPTGEEAELKNVYVRPIEIRSQPMLSFTLRYATKDIVKNYSMEEANGIISLWLGDTFLNADLFTTEADYTLAFNKKRKAKFLTKKATHQTTPEKTHNREKKQWINPSNSPFLKELGITNQKGEVLKNSQRKFRQINKFIEIIDSLLPTKLKDSTFKIVDVGSGKGYLTFALYDYLKNTKHWNPEIYGIELRKPLVDFCNKLTNQFGFEGLHFIAKDIDDFKIEKLDMLIALHACDIATDIAIAKGIQSKAEIIVVAPCCHKQVRKEINCHTEMSAVLKHGILEERQAELITDGIRALLLEAHGYKAKVFEFISTEHTSKNLMIVGIKAKANPEALQKVEAIKKEFGIGFHYLEKLLS
jgi:SAM-dependent methyltransferase